MHKTLQELTLLDRFLFAQTMEYPEAHEAALQIIFNDPNIRLLTPAQTEKEFRTAPWLRSIRVDVFALDENLSVYNTEMQKKQRYDLAKRSRYYQGLIDSSLLEPGSINFNQLNDTFIILIAPFDLFGLGKYCYTFQSCCREAQGLWLEDGAARIFLNTRGTNDEEVSRELRDFLHYLECTDDSFAEMSESERIRKIHSFVQKIRSSEEMGVKYMQAWEEKVLEREEGRKEGRKEGRDEGILLGTGRSIEELLKELGPVPEKLHKRILEEKDLDTLNAWLKLAARASSVEDFCFLLDSREKM